MDVIGSKVNKQEEGISIDIRTVKITNMIALLSVDRIAWIEIVGTPLLVHVVMPRCILKLGIVSMYW